ncbi:MAG: GNAT family N-acetyltransferase [Flavobacteriales bacterium]|nr:GNAT family N-acetyltransferase [Bacteroidota bacterium]MCB9240836.1 GNAT family N-acetyltransferase [Flavobacteriales bacterium]
MTQHTIQLDIWAVEDAPLLAEYANNPKIAQNLTDAFPHPYTLEHAEMYIDRALKNSSAVLRCIRFNDRFVGAIGLHPLMDIFSPSAELGYWVAEPFWHKGIATSAIQQMVKLGFEQLDISRIFARPFGSNVGSQRALEEAGFQLEIRLKDTILKNHRLEDELIYSVRR